MAATPTRLSLTDRHTLLIEWSDGASRAYDVSELRRRCPCATCRSLRAAHEVGTIEDKSKSPVTIQRMSPAGNYAYKIEFSDGHTTGIYTLDLLRELGT